MARTKRALAKGGAVALQDAMCGLALAAAYLAPAAGSVTAGMFDCKAINAGALNVELDAAGKATRTAALMTGETITFVFRADHGPFGTVELMQRPTPRLLLVGPTGTRVTFVAATRGSFVFQLSSEAEGTAAFTATCAAGQTVQPRPRKLPTDGWKTAEASAPEAASLAFDAAAPASRDVESRLNGVVVQQARAGLPTPSGAPALQVQWRDPRLKPGADGPEIDGNASGVDIAVRFKPQPEIVIGAQAQFDQPGDTLVGAPRTLLDQGWMAGPVANIKLAPGLSLDTRAAWGITETSADELAAKTTSAARRTVSARLANVQTFGPWRLTPSLSINHVQDGMVAAVTPHEPATLITTGSYGRVDVGPELAYRMDLGPSIFIEPKATIGKFWNFDDLSRLAPGIHTEPRGKAEAGVTIGTTDGTKMQAAGGVEEGEAGAANVWSGRLQLTVPIK